MIALETDLSDCEDLLRSLGVLPVFDPFDIPRLDGEDLAALNSVLKKLRPQLRALDDRALASATALRAMIVVGVALASRGRKTERYTEAWESASQAIAYHPLRLEGYLLRSQVGLLRGHKRRRWLGPAIDDCQRVLTFAPDDVSSRYVRALCRELPALRQLREVKRRRVKGAERRLQRLVEEAEESLSLALEDLDRLLQGAPGVGLARLHRARCASQLGRFREASADLDVVISEGLGGLERCRQPQAMLARAYLERGELRSAQHDYQGALEDLGGSIELRRSVELDIDRTLVRRASLALLVGEHQQALEDSAAVLELGLDDRALSIHAQAAFGLGHFDMARAEASKLLSYDAGDIEARLLRARCSAALGSHQTALVDADRCLELRPGFEECEAFRRQLLGQ